MMLPSLKFADSEDPLVSLPTDDISKGAFPDAAAAKLAGNGFPIGMDVLRRNFEGDIIIDGGPCPIAGGDFLSGDMFGTTPRF